MIDSAGKGKMVVEASLNKDHPPKEVLAMTDLKQVLEAVRKALAHRPKKEEEPGDTVLLNKWIEEATLDPSLPCWYGFGAEPQIDPRQFNGWWN